MTEWNKKQLAINYELGRPLDRNVMISLFKKIAPIVSLRDKIILDAGCGTGRISIPLSEEFNSLKVVGIDKSSEMTNVLKEKISKQKIKNFEVITGNLSKIKYPDDYFDISIISSVLHSIPDWKQVITEIVRVTKKGGYLFLISEQGEIYDLALERKISKNHGLLDRFWGIYIELRHKYDLENAENTQVGLKWQLGEPDLINYLIEKNYLESKSGVNINWKKDFSIKESMDIIENKCWSSMFTADDVLFSNLVRDMKQWIKDEKISLQDTYASKFVVNCEIIKLKRPTD